MMIKLRYLLKVFCYGFSGYLEFCTIKEKEEDVTSRKFQFSIKGEIITFEEGTH